MKPYLKPILLAILISALIPAWGFWRFGSFQPLTTAEIDETADATVESSVSLNMVGDVMLAREVGRLAKSEGLFYPVAQMAAILKDADITFGNLECSLSDRGMPIPSKGIWLRADPANVGILEEAGFDIVNLANNHAMDYEEPALLQTLAVLDKAGVSHIGAGADLAQATAPLIEEIKGVRIAWLGYSEMADLYFSASYPRPMRAGEDSPGVSPFDLEKILADIGAVKDKADIVIVTLHWGVEYADLPLDYQVRAAHQMVEAGADLIVGHHPHCIQGVEVYKKGLIAYSLGNFIFDQGEPPKTAQGLLMQVTVNKLGWQSAQFLPVYIEDCQPRSAEGALGEEILNKLRRLSAPFGGSLEIKENKLLVSTGDTEEQ